MEGEYYVSLSYSASMAASLGRNYLTIGWEIGQALMFRRACH